MTLDWGICHCPTLFGGLLEYYPLLNFLFTFTEVFASTEGQQVFVATQHVG